MKDNGHVDIEDLQKAIRRKCFDCVCGEVSEVHDCLIPDCGLYPYRPRPKLPKPKLKKIGRNVKKGKKKKRKVSVR